MNILNDEMLRGLNIPGQVETPLPEIFEMGRATKEQSAVQCRQP